MVDNWNINMPQSSNEMYAPASPFSRPIPIGARALSAYHQVGVQTSVSNASPHELVKLLIEGFFDAVAKARGAMRAKDIEIKGKELSRAVRIVDEGLKASLDMQRGGELSSNLRDLYVYITMRLTQANLKNDEAALDECCNLMNQIREAWMAIAPQPSNPNTQKEASA